MFKLADFFVHQALLCIGLNFHCCACQPSNYSVSVEADSACQRFYWIGLADAPFIARALLVLLVCVLHGSLALSASPKFIRGQCSLDMFSAVLSKRGESNKSSKCIHNSMKPWTCSIKDCRQMMLSSPSITTEFRGLCLRMCLN